jgi:hypothetical protein
MSENPYNPVAAALANAVAAAAGIRFRTLPLRADLSLPRCSPTGVVVSDAHFPTFSARRVLSARERQGLPKPTIKQIRRASTSKGEVGPREIPALAP